MRKAINRWKVHSKMSAKWCLLYFRSRAWLRGSFRTCLCLFCMPNVCKVCGWSTSIATLTKMFCKNKKSNTNYRNKSRKQSKKLKKKQQQQSWKKERLIRCWNCLSEAWNFYLRQLSLTVPRFSNKSNQ